MDVVELFYRMARLPWAFFAYGLQALSRWVADLREIAEGGLDLLDDRPWHDAAALASGDEPVDHDFEPTPFKEVRSMNIDQDLSGDMVKAVQYCILSVVTGIADDAKIVLGPCLIAFGDDMTEEDFTAWIMAKDAKEIEEHKKKWLKKMEGDPDFPPFFLKCFDRKFLRVAYTVMGRFSPAAIDWEQMQAVSVARIADRLAGWPFPPPQLEGRPSPDREPPEET